MKITTLLISGAFLLFSFSVKAQIVDVKKKGDKFDHLWSKGVGAGRANEGLRAGWLEQLEMVKRDHGFEYVRFHGLFHDDMFPYFEKNGKASYNWQYIDELFDRMLNLGVKPFVELAFFPKDIAAANSKTQFWWKANISVDRNNFGKWHDLVKAFTQHVTDRYGKEEVLTWYFEVWNEPNLNPGFLDGTKSDYFRLYKESALAVKSVDSRYRVGGPSTSNFVSDSRFDGEVYDKNKSIFWKDDVINTKQWKGVWIEDFLEYCKREKLPVDFISTHPYPTDYALDPETGRGRGATRYINSTKDDILWLRKILAKSKYPNAEIHLTEWSTSPNSRDQMHDHLPPAAFLIKVNLDVIGLANSLMYWTFTDIFEEKGGGETIFHGGFGLINYQGIVKPSYHGYRMLHQLGDEKLYYTDPLFVSRSSKNGKISAIAFNYPKEFESKVPAAEHVNSYMKASSKQLDVTFKNLEPNALFEIEILNNTNGNIMAKYKELGSPQSPNRETTQLLKNLAQGTVKTTVKADADGTLIFKRELSPWECVLLKQL
ncbi:GH39 family glycosyl hydrolase [Desertivirga xinjiangensis]|uniref:GH39 family glycosyl hydrolase n=1 Tax=Desertivirga xinjiangensis TaxID=539206 RepID=UPI00210ECE0C|nr:glycoside hydrolase [Pedobacter xinjiangensis]